MYLLLWVLEGTADPGLLNMPSQDSLPHPRPAFLRAVLGRCTEDTRLFQNGTLPRPGEAGAGGCAPTCWRGPARALLAAPKHRGV